MMRSMRGGCSPFFFLFTVRQGTRCLPEPDHLCGVVAPIVNRGWGEEEGAREATFNIIAIIAIYRLSTVRRTTGRGGM